MTPFIKDFSSNTLSVLFFKHKRILLGRFLCLLVGILFFYFWSQVRNFDVLFSMFFVGLFGVAVSMNTPYSRLHILSLPLLFVPYVILPVLINQTGLTFVLFGLAVAMLLYVKNNKKPNALMQFAMLAPTLIFITIMLLT